MANSMSYEDLATVKTERSKADPKSLKASTVAMVIDIQISIQMLEFCLLLLNCCYCYCFVIVIAICTTTKIPNSPCCKKK